MADDCIKIIQITDCHLFDDEHKTLAGLKTRQGFESVALQAKGFAMHTKPDLIMLTGDISQDGTAESYEVSGAMMQGFECPIAWCPGNHDIPSNMQAPLIQAGFSSEKRFVLGTWQIILLNSYLENQVAGMLPESELNFLAQCLSEKPELNSMVVLHHHVFPTNSKWLDQHILKNSDDLLEVLAKHQQVKVVLSGHVHMESTYLKNGVAFLTTPSTCLQFKPNSSSYGLDDVSPGFRWFNLFENGQFHTGVTRVKIHDWQVDLNNKGY